MADIFTNLYNKVVGFFRKVETEESAKDVACNRLRVVLMQDRTNLTPEIMQRMRSELIDLLSKYLEMDKDALELNLEQDGDQMALALSIPVIRAKDEDEIAEAEEKAAETEEESSEEENEDEISDTENDENDSDDETVETEEEVCECELEESQESEDVQEKE
ncbi:cell division topological specificity factor MinE [bacterium]|nr:cell division topological specificity factor MinE [bacterium]